MTLASDQNSEPDKLSPTSQKMLALREDVFSEWEKRVRGAIKEAKELRHPILVDTLPTFYDNIAEAVSLAYPRASALASTSLATEHGGERARLTPYDPHALIEEYQILRWTVFDVLYQNGVQLNHQETLVINASLDAAIREAVNAFTLVHAALRERFFAALAHDLRNPLSAANVATELILQTAENTNVKRLAAKAIENHMRIDAMIHDLLDSMMFQRGSRLRLDISSFDMLELVKEVQMQFATEHGNQFRIAGNPVRGCPDLSSNEPTVRSVTRVGYKPVSTSANPAAITQVSV